MLARIRSLWNGLWRRSNMERDMEDELRLHIEERADALENSGLRREEAVRRARLEFGAVENYKEQCREARGLRWPGELMQDLRYAIRMARKSRGVTIVAVLSLALGIGANTAIFSILNSLLLTSLPIRDPGGLVHLQVWRQTFRGAISYPLYQRFRANLRGKLFEDICATGAPGASSASLPGADPIQIVQANVTANYFDVLGVRMIRGQAFSADQEKIGSGAVAVISERLWTNRFGSDPGIVGKTLLINEKPATILGIVGGNFSGVEIGNAVDLWVNVTSTDPKPLALDGWNFLQVFGRLAPLTRSRETQVAVQTVFDTFGREKRAGEPDNARSRQLAQQERIVVESGATGISRLRERFALPLRIIMCVVALVLLIACANITNLLLARAAARQREIATRLSLGAGTARLFRQFLTESLLLSLCGGLLGLAVAAWTSQHLFSLVPQGRIPVSLDVHLSWRVLLFTSAVSIGVGLLFGIIPALRVSRSEVVSTMKFTSASDFGGARGRIRPGKLLSIAQIALSTMLVFGAGLFVRTLVNLKNVDPGFRAEHAVTFGLNMPRSYSQKQKNDAQRLILERANAIPGVTGATVSWPGPFNGGGFTGSFNIPGTAIPEDLRHDVVYVLTGPKFFSIMGTPLLAGRDFDARDSSDVSTADALRVNVSNVTVAIVNESLVKTYFGGKNPVGTKIQPFPKSQEPVFAEVVGVVRDIRHAGLREQPRPAVYLPITEMEPPWGRTFEVRLGKDLTTASRELQQVVAGIDPRLKLEDFQTMDQSINAYLEKERLLATIASLFSGIALLLAAVGLYGVMSYAVARRTNEIGLRMALGAQRRQVLDMIVADGASVAALGVVIGVPAAIALSRVLSNLLFDVKAGDAGSLIAPVTVMLCVAMIAVLLPAWRATRVDPMIALRNE
jgi:predicted permease